MLTSDDHAHLLRLTVRVPAEDHPRDVDVCVPASLAFDEIVDDLVHLAGVAPDPPDGTGWQLHTPAGLRLDPLVPFAHSGLRNGSLLLLEPAEYRPAPAVRDVAETIAATDATGIRPGWASGTAWLAGLGALAATSWRTGLPTLWILSGSALLALGTTLALRGPRLLPTVSLILTGLTTYFFVTGTWSVADPLTVGMGAASAAGSLVAGVLLLYAVRALPLRWTVALLTAAVWLGLGCGAWLWSGRMCVGACLVVVGSLLTGLGAASLAMLCARVSVPALPAPGEDLAVSDSPPPDPELTARAIAFHDGLVIGITAAVCPALLSLAAQPDPWVQALCAVAAGASLLHCLRFHRHAPATATLIQGSCALVALSLSALAHPAALGIGALAGLALTAVPFVALRPPSLSPSVQSWLERLETVCIVALIPLAAHVAGLFSTIRGLG